MLHMPDSKEKVTDLVQVEVLSYKLVSYIII